MISPTCSTLKKDTNELIYKTKSDRHRVTDLGLARGRGSWGGTEWEFGVSRCKLIHDFEQTLGDGEDRGVWHAAIHGIVKSWV